MRPNSSVKVILLIFMLCGVVDFVFGYVNGRSMLAGIVWVVLGVFGTAAWMFFFRPWKG